MDSKRMGIHSRGLVPKGENDDKRPLLSHSLWSIKKNHTQCLQLKKWIISKRNKSGKNNTATQSGGRNMRLPTSAHSRVDKLPQALWRDPVGRPSSAVK